MKTICITAACSKLGKTALAERLIPRLKGWGGICNSLNVNFEIENGDEVIRSPGTDTGRYADAGAEHIVWIKSRPQFIDEALKQAILMLEGCRGIIFEGNHVLRHHSPDLAVMIISKTGDFKDSALAVKDKVDLFFNTGEYDQAVEEIIKQI